MNLAGRRWSLAACVAGSIALVTGFTLLTPLAGIALAVVAKSKEPQHAALSRWGLGFSIAGLALGAILVAVVGTSPLGLTDIQVDVTPPTELEP